MRENFVACLGGRKADALALWFRPRGGARAKIGRDKDDDEKYHGTRLAR